MTAQMSDTFAFELWRALVQHVNAEPVRQRRTRWRWIAGVGAAALLFGGGAVAAAGGLITLPGANVTDHLASPISFEHTGSAEVELGAPPKGANAIELTLTCLTAGTFTYADGAAQICSEADVGHANPGFSLPLAQGQHTTTISTADTSRWRLTATYSHVRTTEWGINANGQTYGVSNEIGVPDLIAVIASNGKTGYAFAADLDHVAGGSPRSPEEALAMQKERAGKTFSVPVYKSDGRTLIGEFVMTAPTAIMSPETP